MSTPPVSAQGDTRQRRALQLVFIFVNLVLIEVHVPGGLWVFIGGAFWVTMVVLAALGGSWMCGWVCWIGGIQDFFEPLARSRVRLNPRWGKALVLLLLVSWVPIAWWLVPTAATTDYTPFGMDLASWPRHLFQFGMVLFVGASVMVLGKRGICRYLCPFNEVVGVVRRWLPRSRRAAPRTVAACTGCQQCAIACRTQPGNRVGEIIPLMSEQAKPKNSDEELK
ncbi:MAG: 4Fe-4S binding protein [Roseiflexaceae bacterium]|nr:4Fe-4S binding protein [Roseiflexaceae bacterium]